MNASNFHARAGERVIPKLNALARFILGASNINLSGTGLRRHKGQRGTQIVADMQGASFGGAFPVTLRGSQACMIGLGTVNGATIPTINGVPINGMIEGKQEAVPELEIEGGPNDELRSWVCLRATPKEGEGDKVEFEYEAIHTNDDARLDGSEDDQKRGFFPLAMLIWSGDSEVSRVVRNTWFNQRHSYDEKAKWHNWSAS